MRIHIASVMVDDQEKALQFYTEKLGFVLKHDIPAGGARWLTVVSPEGPAGVELLLEPVHNPAVPARECQQALYEASIPWTSFDSGRFAMAPTRRGRGSSPTGSTLRATRLSAANASDGSHRCSG